MITPKILHRLGQHASSFESVGKIVCCFCQNPIVKREDLTPWEATNLDMLLDEDLEMSETMEKKREIWAKVKRDRRADAEKCPKDIDDVQKTKKCPKDTEDVQKTLDVSKRQKNVLSKQTNKQTNEQTNEQTNKQTNECIITRTRTREEIPILEEVTAAAADVNVPDWYCRWWYGYMQGCDWTTTKGAKVTRDNWRPMLKAWWNRTQQNEKELATIEAEAKGPKPGKQKVKAFYTAKDWVLCRERCRNFKDGKCTCGISIPPALDPDWPLPPERCNGFKPIIQEK